MKFVDVPQSGSYAGYTHAHNRAGQYRRNRRTPVNTIGTGRRAIVRSNFSAAAKLWGGLTSAERAAWVSYASEYPRTDALGQSFTLTGSQMFIALTASLLNAGSDPQNDPPATNVTPVLTDVTLTVVSTAGVVVMTLSGSSDGTEDDFILYSYAAPVGAGVSFMKTFWQAAVSSGDTCSNTPITVYTAQFGKPAVGQRVFAKITPVNSSGVSGAPTILSAICTGT